MKNCLKLVLLALFLCSCSSIRAVKNTENLSCDHKQEMLSIAFLNVGQGDGILITCPGGEDATLIDGGSEGQEYPNAGKLFKRAFNKYSKDVKRFQAIINTHPHPDHIANLNWVINQNKKRPVKLYIDNGANFPEKNHEENVRKNVSKRNIQYINVDKDPLDSLQICPNSPSVKLDFINLSVAEKKKLNCPKNLNECSIVTKLIYDNFSALLLADAMTMWENNALENREILSQLESTAVKVGHHGVGSSGKMFVEAVSPEIAILTTGHPKKFRKKGFWYPTSRALKNLDNYFKNAFTEEDGHYISSVGFNKDGHFWERNEVSEHIYSTASHGTVVINACPDEYSIEKESN